MEENKEYFNEEESKQINEYVVVLKKFFGMTIVTILFNALYLIFKNLNLDWLNIVMIILLVIVYAIDVLILVLVFKEYKKVKPLFDKAKEKHN